MVINTTAAMAKKGTTLLLPGGGERHSLMTVTHWHNSGPAQASANDSAATAAPLWPSLEEHQSHSSGASGGCLPFQPHPGDLRLRPTSPEPPGLARGPGGAFVIPVPPGEDPTEKADQKSSVFKKKDLETMER